MHLYFPGQAKCEAESRGESGISTGGLLLPGVTDGRAWTGVVGISTSANRALAATDDLDPAGAARTIRTGVELGLSSLKARGLPRQVLMSRLTRLRRCAARFTLAQSARSIAPAKSTADAALKMPGAQYRCFPRELGQRCPGCSFSVLGAGPGDGLISWGSYQDEVWLPTTVGSQLCGQITRAALEGRGAVRRSLECAATSARASTMASAGLRWTSTPSALSKAACSVRALRRRYQRCWVLR